LTELKHILRKTQQFFDEQEQVSYFKKDQIGCGMLEKNLVPDVSSQSQTLNVCNLFHNPK
jgi:hypothetical protein